MLTLGIETSCDETSVALMEENGAIRANLIASQIETHRPFGGVVPEIASREHLRHLMPLVEQALREAGAAKSDLGQIAVTNGPGLIGALLVGVAGAQGLAYGLGLPLLPVNHLEGHIYSPYLRSGDAAAPLPRRFLTLVVSGGHSSIYDVGIEAGRRSPRALNRTRDDAAGEVFDKVAKFIGLPYPGGPQVDRLAQRGTAGEFRFPLAQLKDAALDFSFSGLKAHAIRLAREKGLTATAADGKETHPDLVSFCASFQKAICDQLLDRLERVWSSLDGSLPEEVAIAGGVAANSELRERVSKWGKDREVITRLPERRFCTDNAAMIAFAALQRGNGSDPRRVEAYSRAAVR